MYERSQRSINFKKTFWYPQFLQKTNQKIRLNYYDTSSWLVFVRFLEEFEDTKNFGACLHDFLRKDWLY